MDKVTVYRFRSYDIQNDQIKTSRRWGTREAIKEIACGEVIEDSGIEVDAKVIASDIQGMTDIGYNPEQQTGFPAEGSVGVGGAAIHMPIKDLQDFSQLLCSLPVGQSATLPLVVYAHLFPPGEPDQGARAKASDFAKQHGCEIRNPTAAGQAVEVVFIKRVTHPPACQK